MSDAVWEPRTFAVGERVRVKLSAECRLSHDTRQDGMTGTILRLTAPRHLSETGHRYVVIFDTRYALDNIADAYTVGGAFAGAELASLARRRGDGETPSALSRDALAGPQDCPARPLGCDSGRERGTS